MLTPLALLSIPVMFSLADRLSGSPVPLPGRQLWWASGLLAIGLALVIGPLAIFAFAFALWRSPGWAIFGGSLNPVGSAQLWGTLERHLLAVPVFAFGTALLSEFSPLWTVLAVGLFIIWALIATLLAYFNGRASAMGRDITWMVELLRGLALGGTLSVLLAIAGTHT